MAGLIENYPLSQLKSGVQLSNDYIMRSYVKGIKLT